MSNSNVKPTPSPSHDAVILRVIGVEQRGRGIVMLELTPETVLVVDFYPPPRNSRRLNGQAARP